MKEKDLQKYMHQDTWFHGTTLSGWKNLCKYKVLADYNKGMELDFGYGFYLAPKYKQAERYINRILPYLPSNSKDEKIGVVIEFELKLDNYLNFKYCSFLKFNEDFANFVITNRLKPNIRQHDYDFIVGIMSDSNPLELIMKYRRGEMQYQELATNFMIGNSMEQVSLHNQIICDKLRVRRAVRLDNGKELDIDDYNRIL